jgi:hypothetical protein
MVTRGGFISLKSASIHLAFAWRSTAINFSVRIQESGVALFCAVVRVTREAGYVDKAGR